MFTLPTDPEEKLLQEIIGRVCSAADGSYIVRARGRKPGLYFVYVASGGSFKLTAPDDETAVELANKRLEERI
jgi:hypothetical protein